MSDEWTTPAGGNLAHPPADDGAPVLALAAGLVAAVVGGAIWAGIAIYGNVEVGWVAWGIGLLVGGAMARMTVARSRSLAVAAAMLALVGLLAGKAITFASSAGPMAKEMVADHDYMRGLAAWGMYSAETLAPELQDAVLETEARGDTLSDALWADMLDAAEARLATMTEAEKLDLAHASATGLIRELGLVTGIRLQVSGFDLLWLFLALATAYRIMHAPTVAAVPAEEPKEPQAVG